MEVKIDGWMGLVGLEMGRTDCTRRKSTGAIADREIIA